MSKKAELSPARKSRPGVCAYMASLILGGMDDVDEISKRAHRKFRESRATKVDVGIIQEKCAQGAYDHLKTSRPARRAGAKLAHAEPKPKRRAPTKKIAAKK